jgi:hypothetical protein
MHTLGDLRVCVHARVPMRRRHVLLWFLLACSKPSTSGSPGTAPDPDCGTRTTDWCAAPAGDPCGAHKNVDACKADPACVGMPYRGESVVACQFDARGFATNCPTVGCRSSAH